MKTSIIITSHNYARYVERCIRSCLNQRPGGDSNEIVVVDDHSDDNTLELIQKFARYPNVRIIANSTNVGVAEAANIGIRESTGQYVVRVDADDYISENFTYFLGAYLELNHDAFGVACDYVLVDEYEQAIERRYADEHPISCGILYRRDLLIQAGLYNGDFRHREEEELRRRLGEAYRLHFLHIPLYRYRMHASNKTKREEYDSYRARLYGLPGSPESQPLPAESSLPAKDALNVVAVIPARGGSKRLPRKNLVPVLGKPLVAWAIDAAIQSRYIGPGNVCVSTDDDEIAQVAQVHGAEVVRRPAALAQDQVWTEPVIQHAVETLESQGRVIDVVVWMNGSLPEMSPVDIDRAIERLISENLREVFAVDRNLRSTSAVRALRRETLFQRRLSIGCGVMILDYVDIHYLSDVEQVEARLRSRSRAAVEER